ncbi:MAG TPA: 16S rRNA (cytosine(1402)-N(4))-methyltransferase RsmH [Gemmatimonadaceae bacterium]|nr:16S rRNA (cytosine(1402)-N(4))-methyltransferase RsmH [Gemmatimonadaceae bacterium]
MPEPSAYHAPVLAGAVTELLGGCRSVLDCTLGGGGHALALLEAGVERVVGVDRDPDALQSAAERLSSYIEAGRLIMVESNYAALDDVPSLAGTKFDGVLLDLGVSSHQIDDEDRGFTFRAGARLDMRMGGDGDATGTAADLLNDADERALATVFRDYGDEPRAARIAHEIVRRRANRPFSTSDDLVGAIRAVLGAKSGAPEFARLFQAVRIAVNDEITGLARALPALRDRLAPAGTMVVIAYHSGEDRLVKNAFREWSAACVCPPRQPVCTCRGRPLGSTLTRRPISASDDEITRNPRARSARLRAWRSVA